MHFVGSCTRQDLLKDNSRMDCRDRIEYYITRYFDWKLFIALFLILSPYGQHLIVHHIQIVRLFSFEFPNELESFHCNMPIFYTEFILSYRFYKKEMCSGIYITIYVYIGQSSFKVYFSYNALKFCETGKSSFLYWYEKISGNNE